MQIGRTTAKSSMKDNGSSQESRTTYLISMTCSALLIFLGTLKVLVLFSSATNWHVNDPIIPIPKSVLLPAVGVLEIVVGAVAIAIPQLRFLSFSLLSIAFISYRTVLFLMLR